MGDGEKCPTGLRIQSEANCKEAARKLGLTWKGSWNGASSVPGCIFANDGRSKVYFNTALTAIGSNSRYAEICSDVNECDQTPCHPNATCKNTIGSYKCTCERGLDGNGTYCVDNTHGKLHFDVESGSPEEIDTIELERKISTSTSWPKNAKTNIDIYFLTEPRQISSSKVRVVGNVVYQTDILERDEKINICENIYSHGTDKADKSLQKVGFDSYDCCFESEIGLEEFKGVYTYNTLLHTDPPVVKACVYGNINFTRTCERNVNGIAQWQDFKLTDAEKCQPKYVKTEKLQSLDNTDICGAASSSNSSQNCKSVVDVAQNLTKVLQTGSPTNTTSTDVVFVTSIIDQIVTNADENQAVEVSKNVVAAVSAVLDISTEVVQKADPADMGERKKIDEREPPPPPKKSTTSKILKSMEQLGDKLGKTVTEDKPIDISTPNILVKIAKVLPVETYTAVVSFVNGEIEVSGNTSSIADSFQGSFDVPSSTLQNNSDVFKGVVYTFAYRNDKLFPLDEKVKDKLKVQSIILSVSLGNGTASGDPAIELTFKKRNTTLNITDDVKLVNNCSYWKFGDVTGEWDDDGCSVVRVGNDSMTCACNHFTNFALLLNVAGRTLAKERVLILSYITNIGCAISLVGLVFTIVIHSAVRKLRETLPSKVLINFSFSLATVLVVFLAGMTRTQVKIECQIISGFLQFFMLATFVWMGVYAVCLYQAIVKVFRGGSNSKFFAFSNLSAWGIPAIIVIVTGSAAPNDMINEQYCFVSGYPFYFGVLLPVAAIILMNTSILITMIVSLKRRPAQSSTKKQINSTLGQMKIAISCGILLGITWVFGLLAVSSKTDYIFIFQLLFCIFNSLQGTFVFVLFTLRNPSAKEFILNMLPGINLSCWKLSNRKQKAMRTLAHDARRRGGKAKESEPSSTVASSRFLATTSMESDGCRVQSTTVPTSSL